MEVALGVAVRDAGVVAEHLEERVAQLVDRDAHELPALSFRDVSGVRLVSDTVPDSSLTRCQTRLWHRL